MNPYQHAAALFPGLPAPRLPQAAQRSGATRSAQRGATQSNPTKRATNLSALGQPSLRLVRAEGGVRSVLTRRIPHADLLTSDEMAPLLKLIQASQIKATRLSQGLLSLRALAHRGQPYGRGGQRAELARSWGGGIERAKDGVNPVLSNSARQAEHAAFGTPRMKAHGPFLEAIVQEMPAINQEVLRLVRVAKARAKLMGVS